MEFKQEDVSEPVSPTGQYFNSSALSVSIIGVLESEIPIDDSPTMALLKDVFLPINPRFSSIMVRDKNGVRRWKRVEVKLKDHIRVPTFPPEKSLEFYDEYLNGYISKIAMDGFPQSRPLWEIHIIKYPTSNAAGTLIFKLHHSMGDGFSLMGALLSCLQRADNPSLPLTFPRFQTSSKLDGGGGSIFSGVPRFFSGLVNILSDFGWSLLKSSLVEDDRTPIRSGDDGVEFRQIDLTTMTFSLDHIKQIKTSLRVSINDVITGIIFYGTRLYMQASSHESRNAHSTALVLLNTRNIAGYKSVDEMVMEPQTETKWGNQFGFLHVPIPELDGADSSDPIYFVNNARQIIKKKRNSGAVYLTGRLLETLRTYRGPERTAQYMHRTLKNSSMTLSNMIGPVEQMVLANHPVRGFYFMVVGVPQSLTITMVSYTGKLRVAVGTEKGLIDPQRFKSCIEKAFDMVFNTAVKSG
ncbi:wax ester synthase/diacylglycerol acyltransferase 4-like [Cornus florida]|uniref:wax ester synthase/diacylglycerol acyltransferase 4-like n=1 Tax=Cornus florida TaxID=4283 RepID=UPI0028A198D8|nr:wax ester synthase/diacylglycerol acyltransferase 4-like [Cornus florida]